MRSAIVDTGGHPAVVGAWRRPGTRPAVLVYGHYDVQPAGDPRAWREPPFEGRIVGDELRGRGTSDDKGQLFAHLAAIEAMLATTGELPVNVTVVLDGEEEIGSPGLLRALRTRPAWAQADAALISDSRMPDAGHPAIVYSQRGLLRCRVSIRRPGAPVHAGQFAGMAADPALVLARFLASLHAADGRVTVPGFYAAVRELDADERRFLAATGPNDADLVATAGTVVGVGEGTYSLYARTTVRPSAAVIGVSAAGNGGAIPSQASAELDFRLVPDQDPAAIASAVASHLARVAGRALHSGVQVTAAAPAFAMDRRHPVLSAVAAAVREGFGVGPRFIRSGGTIPVAALLRHAHGVPVAILGFGLPDDRPHAPNEKLHIPTFFRAIRTSAACLKWLQHTEVQNRD
jgi:acetylornithine deacetylase/succinyl-diaminopimelate desuccinylase-like protein